MNQYFPFMVSAALICFSSSLLAEPLRYTFVSAGYSKLSTELDGHSGDINGDSVSVDFSIAVRPSIAVVAGYRSGKADVLSAGRDAADITSYSLGLVVHLPVNDKTDFILGVSFINGEIDVNDSLIGGDNSGGVGLRSMTRGENADGGMTIMGFRSMMTDKLEFNGYLRKRSLEQASYIGLSLGSAYYVADSVSVDIGFSFDSDLRLLAFGVTKYF